MLKLLITGCARSGLGYLTENMRQLGLKTKHYNAFDSWPAKTEYLNQFDVVSTWTALPHLQELAENIPVIHLIRQPYKTIRSISKLGLLRNDSNQEMPAEIEEVRRLIPNYTKLSPHERAATYWTVWNERIELELNRLQINISIRTNVEEINPQYLKFLLCLLNLKPLQPMAETVWNSVPKDFDEISHKKIFNSPLTLGSSDTKFLSRVFRYGYLGKE